MGVFSKICRGRDLMLAVTQDIISMGGYWIVNGQTKTGELLDAWRLEEQLEPYSQDLLDHICKVVKEASDDQK